VTVQQKKQLFVLLAALFAAFAKGAEKSTVKSQRSATTTGKTPISALSAILRAKFCWLDG
jgi:hypothetical protein